jgi:large conductance mechanosensitive channel protein
MKGFKAFLLRGNVVELAVAVVVAVAFGLVIAAFVKDLVTPLIAALFGKPDFGALTFTINNSKFLYGDFINSVVSFVIVVRDCRRGHLFLRRRAVYRGARARSQGTAGRPHDEEVPRVRERDPDRRQALRLLHLAAAGRLAGAPSPSPGGDPVAALRKEP